MRLYCTISRFAGGFHYYASVRDDAGKKIWNSTLEETRFQAKALTRQRIIEVARIWHLRSKKYRDSELIFHERTIVF
jgi:hypothetical protein